MENDVLCYRCESYMVHVLRIRVFKGTFYFLMELISDSPTHATHIYTAMESASSPVY